MWVGRGIVVCRQYMRGSGWRYLRVQAVHLVTLVVLMAGSYRVCALLSGGILGLLGRAVVVCILPNLLNLAFYIWTSDAAYLRPQAGRLWQKLPIVKGETQHGNHWHAVYLHRQIHRVLAGIL